MLENMPRCKDKVLESTYNHYEGVARFWRAWITFKRMKVFGDCYFVDKVIDKGDSDFGNATSTSMGDGASYPMLKSYTIGSFAYLPV